MDLPDPILHALPDDSLLRALGRNARTAFLAPAIQTEKAAGQTLVEQGEPGESLMVLLSGTAKVTALLANGREIVLDILRPGAVIGEMSVLDGGPRAAGVTALEPCALLTLQRRDIQRLIETEPEITQAVIRTLCGRLRRTNLRVEALGLGVAVQLARGLLHLAEDHGTVKGRAVSIPFKLNQSTLAAYVSLSREKVNRQLKLWEDDGLLRLEGGFLHLLDTDLLEEIAEALD